MSTAGAGTAVLPIPGYGGNTGPKPFRAGMSVLSKIQQDHLPGHRNEPFRAGWVLQLSSSPFRAVADLTQPQTPGGFWWNLHSLLFLLHLPSAPTCRAQGQEGLESPSPAGTERFSLITACPGKVAHDGQDPTCPSHLGARAACPGGCLWLSPSSSLHPSPVPAPFPQI